MSISCRTPKYRHYKPKNLAVVRIDKPLASWLRCVLPSGQCETSTPANEFGPKSLKAIREQMVKEDMCRNVVNHNLSRIKRFFRWAVGEELVDPSVSHGLQAVPGLRAGKTAARETEPITDPANQPRVRCRTGQANDSELGTNICSRRQVPLHLIPRKRQKQIPTNLIQVNR